MAVCSVIKINYQHLTAGLPSPIESCHSPPPHTRSDKKPNQPSHTYTKHPNNVFFGRSQKALHLWESPWWTSCLFRLIVAGAWCHQCFALQAYQPPAKVVTICLLILLQHHFASLISETVGGRLCLSWCQRLCVRPTVTFGLAEADLTVSDMIKRTSSTANNHWPLCGKKEREKGNDRLK